MVEVIHNYHDCYPFGHPKESENTFMQLTKENMRDDEITLEREKSKIYKAIASPHFIRLIKTLREDQKMHFVYEYQEESLEMHLESASKKTEAPLSREKYRLFVNEFKSNIDNIVEVLVGQQIKADIFLSNIACLPRNNKNEGFLLKVFFDREAEYLSLIQHSYRAKEQKRKDRSGINQDYLFQFYEAEKKRLMLDFQEMMEKIFGKIVENVEKRQSPNFVINGTKLVFLNTEEKQRDLSAQFQQKKDKWQSPTKNSGNQGYDKKAVTEPKEKNYYPPMPIIDFDQSFQPDFKPEEFIKEKTYIYEERDYLESLEEELNKMAVEKQQAKKMSIAQADKRREKDRGQIKNAKQMEFKKQEQREDKFQKEPKKQVKAKDLTISQGSTQSNPHNQSNNKSKDSNNNLSSGNISGNNDSYQKRTEAKGEKTNKYKMKIITSHQIEIEGGNEQQNVEQIQKQIMEGIRTGKININQLGQDPNIKLAYDKKIQKNEETREKNAQGFGMYQSDHREEARSKDLDENIDKKLKFDKMRHDSDSGQFAMPDKGKEGHTNKMKNINDILEKIGVKSNTNLTYKEQQAERHPQAVNRMVESSKAAMQHTPSIQTTSTPQNKAEKVQKLQRPERVEKGPKVYIQPGDDKNQKAQNYLTKIREAKSKAAQILKQYTKKKQQL